MPHAGTTYWFYTRLVLRHNYLEPSMCIAVKCKHRTYKLKVSHLELLLCLKLYSFDGVLESHLQAYLIIECSAMQLKFYAKQESMTWDVKNLMSAINQKKILMEHCVHSFAQGCV